EPGLTPRAQHRRRGAQQRVVFPFGELLLHLLAHAPVLPPIEQQHQQDEHDAQQDQTDLQITHCQPREELRPSSLVAMVQDIASCWPSLQASASCSADSISTATMRDTPCSCIVTPTSCLAICMAILLCEIKRNCM